jgi:hypothetical protein
MSISMQGSWTVQVKSKSAAFAQRFIIQGSANGVDGVYAGVTTTPSVNVTGPQWSVSIENDQGAGNWTPSAERIGTPASSGGQISFDIRSDDAGGGDKDYNDLVLTCSTSASDSDFVVYGRVKTYSGFCRFNPCFPFPYLVIDSPLVLKRVLDDSRIRAAIEALYPERLRRLIKARRFPIPIPEPDPPAPFRPMMIPLAETEGTPVLASAKARTTRSLAAFEPAAGIAPVAAESQRTTLGAAVIDRYSDSILDLAKFKDFRIFPLCTVKSRPGVLLRFQEYDRTAAELAGGPYTGEGSRQNLGFTVTDELGNYIFHFTRTLSDIAEEIGDIPSGVSAAAGLRPDLIVQIVAGLGATPTVLYESGLFTDIPNLRRIDLCIPADVLQPGTDACSGTRAIQAIGNIFTISGVGNTVDAAGRITATHPSGPSITRGAWGGNLHMFACFLGLPQVKTYTIRFRKPGGGWSFVNEAYTHINKAAIGDPTSPLHKVGPFDSNLNVDGGGFVVVPAYNNIEADPNWVETHRLRKIILHSQIYIAALYATEGAGSVDFRIEGYDASGNKVAGADDTIRLFIDNRPVTGDIASITKGSSTPGECALFTLASPNEVLTVRFKASQPGGFLLSYGLAVFRGSATPVPVADSTAPVEPLSVDYNEATHGNFFFGTANSPNSDGDGYVTVDLQPTSGAWLPAGKNFCAFSFEVDGCPRITNGYSLFTCHRLDFELVGISI